MAGRLADIINVIGAARREVFPRRQITLGLPEAPAGVGIEYTPYKVRPESLYELVEKFGIFPRFSEIYQRRKEVSPSRLTEIVEEVTPEKVLQDLLKLSYSLEPKVVADLRRRQVEALRKSLEIAERTPMTLEQIRSLYEILQHPWKTEVFVETVKEKFPEIVKPSPLIEETKKELTEKAKRMVEEIAPKLREIEIEKLRLPEPIWLREYRGETLAERARKSAEAFNENVKILSDFVQDTIDRLSSPKTAEAIAISLNAQTILDVATELYRHTEGRLDISTLIRQVYDVTSQSKEFLNQISDVFREIFGIKLDLLNEIREKVFD